MKYALLFTGLLAMVLSACGTSTPEPTVTPQESSWYACTTFVQQQVGVSASDAQRYTSSGVTTLANNEFIVEVFYASLGSSYRCGLLRHSNGDWELQSLDVK